VGIEVNHPQKHFHWGTKEFTDRRLILRIAYRQMPLIRTGKNAIDHFYSISSLLTDNILNHLE
jgi:hypothetical protein